MRTSISQGPSRDRQLEIAIDHHMAGGFDEAERIYFELHQRDPDDEEVLYLLGTLCCDLGVYETALRFLREALILSPTFVDAMQQLAIALRGLEIHEDAGVVYAEILALSPSNPQALIGLANLHLDKGESAQAAALLSRASVLAPENVDTVLAQGRLAMTSGRLIEAEKFLAASLGHSESVDALNWLGLCLLQQEKYVDAAAVLERALARAPELDQARNNLGLAHLHQGRLDIAIECFETLIGSNAGNTNARVNLANALRLLGRLDEAGRQLQTVLVAQPNSVEALNNLGTVLLDQADINGALKVLQRAVAIDPHSAAVRWNLALTELTLGHFAQGWANFEYRWDGCEDLRGAYEKPASLAWRGEPLKGKRILLWGEQGYGDTLQFVRFARQVSERGARVTLEVQPALRTLVGSVSGVSKVIAKGDPLTDYDYHCPLMSLPDRLGIVREEQFGSTPYLVSALTKCSSWKKRLEGFSGLRVGLVWAGRARNHSTALAAIDARRSLSLDLLAPLFAVEGASFFSVQKEGAKDIARAGFNHRVTDFSDEWRDFSDTAAFLMQLDLLISVDTAVAHLGGALGKPVWLLNRFDSCWRWLRDREDSPWYGSLRQFRQARPADWPSVIESVKGALLQRVMQHSRPVRRGR